MAPWILKETLNENYNLVSMLLKEVNNITSVETYELNKIMLYFSPRKFSIFYIISSYLIFSDQNHISNASVCASLRWIYGYNEGMTVKDIYENLIYYIIRFCQFARLKKKLPH